MKTIALIDGNSFFASCERVFKPHLHGKPVIVLSNNDGCAIARTAEAKALGIRMAAPYFKIRDLCERGKVAVFSANFPLYSDMSRRMNLIYQDVTPEVEVYSIDESFLDLTGLQGEPAAYAQDIRNRIWRETGIPTCVGLAPTKTLAKVANALAKRHAGFNGICDLRDPALRAHWLSRLPVEDVWGIGRKSAPKLQELGITTAAHLAGMDPRHARAIFSVIGERLVMELCGEPCLDLEGLAPTRKGAMVTRSFSRRLTQEEDLAEALAYFTARLAEKLRRASLGTSHITLFAQSSRFEPADRFSRSTTLPFEFPTNDTLAMLAAARAAMGQLWQKGVRYARAGAMASDLIPLQHQPPALFHATERAQAPALMAAMDTLNRRYGRDAVRPAATGMARTWLPASNMRSPRYTTCFSELPVVG